MWFPLGLTTNLHVCNVLVWQEKHLWASGIWLWTELEAEQPYKTYWPSPDSHAQKVNKCLVSALGSVTGLGPERKWLITFSCNSFIVKLDWLLDLSVCIRLCALKKHLLKQLWGELIARNAWRHERGCHRFVGMWYILQFYWSFHSNVSQ